MRPERAEATKGSGRARERWQRTRHFFLEEKKWGWSGQRDGREAGGSPKKSSGEKPLLKNKKIA